LSCGWPLSPPPPELSLHRTIKPVPKTLTLNNRNHPLMLPPPLPRGKGKRPGGRSVRDGRDGTMVTGGPLARLPNAYALPRSCYPHPSPEARAGEGAV